MDRDMMMRSLLMIACIGWGWLFCQMFGQAAAPADKTGLLRLHVIASGDTAREQAVKLKVRDAVIRTLSDELAEADTADAAKTVAAAREADILDAARCVLAANGESDKVRMEIGRFTFPLRQYGDLVVPAGEYEAVRIIIGEGKGRNWWCVLFPPLCMVDAAVAVSAQAAEQDDTETRRIIYRSKAAELLRR